MRPTTILCCVTLILVPFVQLIAAQPPPGYPRTIPILVGTANSGPASRIFSPPNATIYVDEIIEWQWNYFSRHQVRSGTACTNDGIFAQSQSFNSPGNTYSVTFISAGIYPYNCAQHCSLGMLGWITVLDIPVVTTTPVVTTDTPVVATTTAEATTTTVTSAPPTTLTTAPVTTAPTTSTSSTTPPPTTATTVVTTTPSSSSPTASLTSFLPTSSPSPPPTPSVIDTTTVPPQNSSVTTNGSSSKKKKPPPIGIIIGAAVGGILLLMIVAAVIVFVLLRRRREGRGGGKRTGWSGADVEELYSNKPLPPQPPKKSALGRGNTPSQTFLIPPPSASEEAPLSASSLAPLGIGDAMQPRPPSELPNAAVARPVSGLPPLPSDSPPLPPIPMNEPPPQPPVDADDEEADPWADIDALDFGEQMLQSRPATAKKSQMFN